MLTVCYTCKKKKEKPIISPSLSLRKDKKIRKSKLREIAICLPLARAVKKDSISSRLFFCFFSFGYTSEFNLEAVSSGGY